LFKGLRWWDYWEMHSALETASAEKTISGLPGQPRPMNHVGLFNARLPDVSHRCSEKSPRITPAL
jgi:hypothetical protein